MKKVSIDIADRYEFDLRLRLRSAESLSETAIFRGLALLKTPFSSVSASLSRLTRADQRFPSRFGCFDFARRLIIAANVKPGLPFRALHRAVLGLWFVSSTMGTPLV